MEDHQCWDLGESVRCYGITIVRRPIALSLTPLPLEADSRSLRIAVSLARLGFVSRIAEGQESVADPASGLSIDRTVRSIKSLSQASHPTSASRSGSIASAIEMMRQGSIGVVGKWALYTAFRVRFARRFGAVLLRGDERLIYLHSYEYYAGIAEQARRLGVRIVYDAHDFYQGIAPTSQQTAFDRKFLMPFLRRREAACVAGADAVVTVSNGTADLIEKEYGRRPVVLRNGHDKRLDVVPETDLRSRLGLGPTDTIVVVVGNYKVGMAFESAIEALEILPPNVHIAFVGRGYARALVPPRFRSQVHVDIVVPPREVVPFVSTADIGLVAYRPISDNYRHALPNGFFQVVAAGLPVLYPLLPELVATISNHNVGSCMRDVNGRSIAAGIMQILPNAVKHRQAVNTLAAVIGWENDESTLACVLEKILPSSLRNAD